MEVDAARGGAAALKALRLRAGLSQSQLAEQSGVSARTIRNLEHGTISAPHTSTLTALSAALDLSPDQALNLVRSFARSRGAQTFREVLAQDSHAALQQAINEGRIRTFTDFRSVSTMVAVSVGDNRRVHSVEYAQVTQALRDGADTMLRGAAGGTTCDARLMSTVDLVGCEISADIVDETRNTRTIEMRLGQPLARGELRLYCYRDKYGNHRPPNDPALATAWERLEPEVSYTRTSVRPIELLAIAVTFVGERPARVWEVEGNERQHTRELAVDRLGSVGVSWRNLPAGTHGIEWAWED